MVGVHTICAGTSTQARIWRTVIDVSFTGQPCVSSSAGAQEASKRVGAGPTVLAGV